jgi:hypothetical protein
MEEKRLTNKKIAFDDSNIDKQLKSIRKKNKSNGNEKVPDTFFEYLKSKKSTQK